MPSAQEVARAVTQGAALTLRGVTHAYDSRHGANEALAGIDLHVAPGEFVAVIGATGCGKSTLLRIAGGLLTPSSGTVLIDERPPQDAQRHKRIGFVFQDPALLPWRSVRSNVRLPLEVNRRQASTPADVDTLLATVGLAGAADRRPHELSGGMRQRVALARALALDPALLLMDEPFAALDELTRESMRYELLRIWERHRATVLFVTHSVREAVLLADRVVVMTPGPGRIRAIVPVDLPRPRRTTLERDPAFLDRVDRLRDLLS